MTGLTLSLLVLAFAGGHAHTGWRRVAVAATVGLASLPAFGTLDEWVRAYILKQEYLYSMAWAKVGDSYVQVPSEAVESLVGSLDLAVWWGAVTAVLVYLLPGRLIYRAGTASVATPPS